jgi:2-keto-3-deoxy-L-rhamnonate aldolase RhmA
VNTAAIARLRENKVHIGAWLQIGSSAIAELAAECGLGWLKRSGILLRDPGEVPGLRSLGFSKLAIDSDLGILRTGYQGIMASASAQPQTAP